MPKCSAYTKPQDTRVCQTAIPCPYWRYTPWTLCSKSCGEGFQTRRPVCTGMGLCNIKEQEPVQQICAGILPCVEVTNYAWSFDDWSECSVTCGRNGVKMRTSSCKISGESEIINNSFCSSKKQPTPEIVPCNSEKDCVTGVWITGNWSACSATCEQGYRKRAIGCRVNGHYEIDQKSCDPEKKLEEFEKCDLTSCVTVPPFFQGRDFFWFTKF